jgi:hypothetical protein
MVNTLTLITTAQQACLPRPLVFPGMPLAIREGHGYLENLHGLSAPVKLCDWDNARENNRCKPEEIIIWDGGINNCELPGQIIFRTGSTDFRPGDFIIADNSLRILASHLVGPELIDAQGSIQLRMQPVFTLDYSARYFPAQLGEMRLVESQRSIVLKNGNTLELTDTTEKKGPAVVMGKSAGPDYDEQFFTQIFAPVLVQEHKNFCANTQISQTILSEFNDEPVESITVLEKYTSYFMQRYYDEKVQGYWVPAAPPVTWGWSIRVGKNGEDDWAIVRRKLIMPTVGHEGLQLPQWKTILKNTADGALK